jgi:hypothetical protein
MQNIKYKIILSKIKIIIWIIQKFDLSELPLWYVSELFPLKVNMNINDSHFT